MEASGFKLLAARKFVVTDLTSSVYDVDQTSIVLRHQLPTRTATLFEYGLI